MFKVYVVESFDDFILGEVYFALKSKNSGYAGHGYVGSFYDIHTSSGKYIKQIVDYQFKKHFKTIDELRDDNLNKILN